MLAQVEAVAPEDPILPLLAEGRHREAAALCARLHGAALGRLCMAFVGSQADAEELVQETLMVACAQMASYRGEGTIRSWLFGIARRQCAHRVERGVRERRRIELVASAGADGGPTADSIGRARAVRAALSRLKPSEREALVLHYQGELSFREIAAQCGIDEAAARKRASRGLARLRKSLTSDSVEG